jgi:hypothetical protein
VSDPLAGYYTLKEAAEQLALTESSVRRMIGERTLQARFADANELAHLLATKRIAGVPGTGVRLIPGQAITAARSRRKPGRPARRWEGPCSLEREGP